MAEGEPEARARLPSGEPVAAALAEALGVARGERLADAVALPLSESRLEAEGEGVGGALWEARGEPEGCTDTVTEGEN